MTRLLAWIGIALLAAYVVFIAGAGPGIYTADLRVAALGGAAIALFAWFVVAWRDRTWQPRSRLLPAIAVALGSMTIASAFSRFPRVSVEYLAFGILLAALYLLLVRLFQSAFYQPRLINLARTMFLVIAGSYIVVVVGRWATWWDAIGHLTVPPLRPEFESLTFGNPSHVLMMTALLAVPAAASTAWSTSRGRIWIAAGVVLTAIVALLSGSRAGWLALAVAGAVAVVVILAALRSGLRQGGWARRAWASRWIRLAVLGGLALAAVAAIALAPTVIRRASEGGEQLRLSYVAIALRMFEDAPITGTGLGSWVVQRISYTEPHETDYYIPHAHNIYAQTLAEQGIVGASAGLVVIVSLLLLLRDAVRGGGARRQWGVVTLLGLTYFGVHESLDFMVNLPAVLFALAIPIAYLDATSVADRPDPIALRLSRRRTTSRALRLGGVGATVIALLGLVLQEIPARTSDQAVAHANDGRWDVARDLALHAARADPGISAYLFTAGLVEAHTGNHRAAAEFFRRVAEADDLPEAWLNLAAEELAAGNAAVVPAALAEALRLGWQRPAISAPAGDLALRIGDIATARESFAHAVIAAPSFAADPWWQEDPARVAILPSVVFTALANAPPYVRWEVRLMSGDPAGALSEAPDDATRRFIAGWGGDDAARATLLASCDAQPLNISLLLLCARMEGRVGNIERANEFRYIANAQIGGSYSAGAETRVTSGPIAGRTLEGNPAIFWGTYTYRRPTPWDVLVPSLLHLGLT